MNQRDRELLEKQLRAVTVEQRHDGVLMTAMVVIFLVGLTLGNILAERSATSQLGAGTTSIAFLNRPGSVSAQ